VNSRNGHFRREPEYRGLSEENAARFCSLGLCERFFCWSACLPLPYLLISLIFKLRSSSCLSQLLGRKAFFSSGVNKTFFHFLILAGQSQRQL